MSLHRQFVSAFVWFSMVVFCSTATAQGLLGHHQNDSADFDTLYDPFCEHDTDWFEPIYCECSEQRPLNSGWYFSYSRLRTYVSRPREAQPAEFYPSVNFIGIEIESDLSTGIPNELDGDSTWGNRFDFGFITDDGIGYSAVLRKLNNPNVLLVEPNLNIDGTANIGSIDGDDFNNSFLTLNSVNVYSAEITRSWRLPPTPKGVILEPLYGLRYMRIRDHGDRRDIFLERMVFPAIGIPNTTDTGLNQDTVVGQEITTDNDLFGGHFGIRSASRRGRWVFVADVRGLVFGNFEARERIKSVGGAVQTVTATYDANGNLTNIATGAANPLKPERAEINDDSGHFVYGGQLYLDTTFEITRGFGVRLGGELLALADGIGRGKYATDDSFLMGGLTFGFSLNR